jgi:chaperonin GroEL (HSP60 family)
MKTHETKIPLVVVAQGFSEEVVATLKANQERKNFDCIPVRIMPDLESLNVINDIGIVAGGLPISSMKGDLLTFVKYDDLPLVDKVRCSQTDLVIENNSTKNQVNGQIKHLLEKRQSEQVNDIVDLLDKRLKSLVANTVTIYLPNVSPMAIDDIRVKLDNALRAAKTILNYGVVDVEAAIKAFVALNLHNTAAGLNKAFVAGFQNVCNLKDKNEWPTLSLMAVTSLAGKAMLMLLMSNGMVHFT